MILLKNEHCDNVTPTSAQTVLLVVGGVLAMSIHPYSSALITAAIALAGLRIGSAYVASHRDASVIIKTVCAAISMYATIKMAATLWGVGDMSYLTIGGVPEAQYRFFSYLTTDILSVMYLLNANNVLSDPNSTPSTCSSQEYVLYGMYPTTILAFASMVGIVAATTQYAAVYSAVAAALTLSICANVLFQLLFVKILRVTSYVYCFISISVVTSAAASLKLVTRLLDHINGGIAPAINMIGIADVVAAVDVIESIVLLTMAFYMLITITKIINGGTHERSL